MNQRLDAQLWQEAHDFLRQHQRVVYGALVRLRIRPGQPDFDDWFQEATIIYIQYYCRYNDPRDTSATVRKFNRLAGHFVYLNLLDQLRTRWRRAEIAPQSPWTLPDGNDRDAVDERNLQSRVEHQDALSRLLSTLTTPEQRVLHLKLRGLNNVEVGHTLGLSRYQVIRIMQKVRKQYLLLHKLD